ncbi:MAG: hypothetical protein ACXWRZ_12685 [Bdellovibrio sp.]
MDQEILSVLSVILFCVCCHQFIKTIVTPIPVMSIERRYAFQAMQLSKFYKTLAWGAMTTSFLIGLIFSFSQVFTTL